MGFSWPRSLIYIGLSTSLFGGVALGEEDTRLPLLEAMEQELTRSVNRLELPGHEAPYFLAYQMTEIEDFSVYGKYGALFSSAGAHKRLIFVEARVGDYDLDNTNIGAYDFDPNQVENPYVTTEAPLDDNIDALKQRFWLLTDDKYKEALSGYLRKQGMSVYTISEEDDKKLSSFTKEQPSRFVGDSIELQFDAESWENAVRSASAVLKDYSPIFDGDVSLGAHKVTRYYVNSEGTRLLDERVLYSMSATAMTRADDGMYLDNAITHYYREASQVPTGEALNEMVRGMANNLMALREAPVLEPYTGPAILEAEATGVLFHESVGHRLEGERQNSEEEGQTFKEQVGSVIVPEFLSIVDDPTLKEFEGQQLNGHYQFDDEGVPAQRVELVQNGVLKGFLMSRSPVAGLEQSNGHGRSAGIYDPIARMGNFMVTSTRAIPHDQLKAKLMEECQRTGKPYGLIVRDIEGGSTNTSSYGYQAFKGSPRLVYRVDATTGEETLVRGVEMVGTPLTVISKVLATGDQSEIFNGYCGAESGYVPVSTIAPAILLSEIELQRTHSEPARLPVLLAPLNAPEQDSKKSSSKSSRRRRSSNK